jgi:Bifunctional DNA primase/polymerase, N-terminal
MARDFNRDWAMRMAEAGLAGFPCGNDKKPLIKWREFSSSDPEAIAQWWRQFPGALPAIDLEKCDLFVLDGDRHGGPDGRTALRKLLKEQNFDYRTAPSALTPNDGVHVYLRQNGHELGNTRGKLPAGVDARGCGGYVIAPYATLSNGRRYKAVPGTPDLISAYKAGTIPHVPQGIVDLIHASDRTPDQEQNFSSAAGAREQAYAQTALEGCMAELAGTSTGNRNEKLNAVAYRLGRMIARGWLDRTAVEGALLGAMFANGAVADDGLEAAKATLKSGIDAGIAEPHPDLTERDEKPQATEAPKAIYPCTLADVHATFQKWFGKEYDIATLDAVLAAAAAEKLPGDPPWLLIISGPGNAKTETVGATSGLNARVVSTITSEGALLSASPRKSRAKTATGGLLRQIGEHGILTIKDFTSIISTSRETRTQVLAALREIYDGHWVRNVGSDGGQSLEWKGRLIVIGACTTAWDQAHGVVATMGDRFVLIRSDSSAGPSRIAAGTQAIRNAGTNHHAAGIGGGGDRTHKSGGRRLRLRAYPRRNELHSAGRQYRHPGADRRRNRLPRRYHRRPHAGNANTLRQTTHPNHARCLGNRDVAARSQDLGYSVRQGLNAAFATRHPRRHRGQPRFPHHRCPAPAATSARHRRQGAPGPARARAAHLPRRGRAAGGRPALHPPLQHPKGLHPWGHLCTRKVSR